MRGTTPAWIVLITKDENVSQGIMSGKALRRTKTSASILAMVSATVDKIFLSHLQAVFDFVIYVEETLQPDLHGKNNLFVQSLKLRPFSKVAIVDAGVLILKQSDHLFDNADVLVNEKGEWKIAVFNPNLPRLVSAIEFLGSEWKYDDVRLQLIPDPSAPNVKQLICSYKDLQNNYNAGNPINYVEADIPNQQVIPPHISEEQPYDTSCVNTGKWIAIVGLSCRFPGANSIEEYWDILKNGRGTSAPPSDHRLSISNLEKSVHANFLKCEVDEFDASFFNMSPTEVMFADVQGRLLLELSWEAFEDAGIIPDSLRSKPVGIFHGSWINDYKDSMNYHQHPNQEFIRKYIGNGFGSTAAKLSFFYGFNGPNIATESGCSSSMKAVELACKSLLEGECPIALATGANIILQNDTKTKLVWAEDGICRTFDANANGYGRAEGVAVVILKRYSDAVRDGDRIQGVILGSASSQEGLSRSFGTPTVECEAMAMEKALMSCGLSPNEIDYVEAHATGTGVGDPIEAAAIVRAYSGSRDRPLLIGSGKTNIGHTEACSGLAGLIKVILALKHEIIPPHIHLESLNPKVNFQPIPGEIVIEATPWKRSTSRKRVAGVSNFGITGTDIHMIIQEAPLEQKQDLADSGKPPIYILALSAKNELALEQLLNAYTDHIQSVTGDSLDNILFTANACRTHHSAYRKVAMGTNLEELVVDLKTKTKNILPLKGSSSSMKLSKICFYFGNQQRNGLNLGNFYGPLYTNSPVFKFHMSECDKICKGLLKVSLLELLKASGNVDDKEHQLLTFAVSYSLFKLWKSWEVTPDLIIGCGFGELAGQAAASILTLEHCFTVIANESMGTENNSLVSTESVPYLSLKNEEPSELHSLATGFECIIEIAHEKTLQLSSSTNNCWYSLISTLTSLYEAGYGVNWGKFYEPYRARYKKVSLPHYPFQHKAFWFDSGAKTTENSFLMATKIHPLLGAHIQSPTNDKIYQNSLAATPNEAPYLADHIIGSAVIYPAAGFLEMALAAIRFQGANSDSITIENFTVHHPLHLEVETRKTIQTLVSPPCKDTNTQSHISVHVQDKKNMNDWKLLSSCDFVPNPVTTTLESQLCLEILKAKMTTNQTIPSQFYSHIRQAGLMFGPRFHSIKQLYQSEDETLAELTVLPDHEEKSHICHPLLIDAMFQCFILHKNSDSKVLHVPVSVKKFTFNPRQPNLLNDRYFVYCNSNIETVYLLDSNSTIIAVMECPMLKKTTIGSMLSAAGVIETNSLMVPDPKHYEIFWKIAANSSQLHSSIDLCKLDDYTDTPSFLSLLEFFKKRNRLTPREQELDQSMTKLTGLYVLKALLELGWQPKVNESFNANELAIKLKVVKGLRPALVHFMSYLVSNGVLKKCLNGKPSNFVIQQAPGVLNIIEEEIVKSLHNMQNYAPLKKVIHPCGSQLGVVLKGSLKAQSILFDHEDENGLNRAEFYYKTSRFTNNCGMNVMAKVFMEVVKEIWKRVRAMDSNKTVRILEVGAGTGRFTAEVLSGLEEDGIDYQYYFSDISSLFFSRASKTFSTYSNNLVFKRLDIESDPLEQGFSPAYFDIIVGLEVLHATKNLVNTLKNVAKVTKAGGILIIGEMNEPINEVDTVFGILDGYWLFEDYDVRATHCTVDVNQWEQLMKQVGFSHSIHKILCSGSKTSLITGRLASNHKTTDLTNSSLIKNWLLVCDNESMPCAPGFSQLLRKARREGIITDFSSANKHLDELFHTSGELLEGVLLLVEDDSSIEPDKYRALLEPLLEMSKTMLVSSRKISLPKFFVATKGCSPIAATLWGFVRSVKFEMLGLISKLIDLDPQCDVEERLQSIYHEIWMGDDEAEIQIRNGIRSVRRIKSIKTDGRSLEIPMSTSGDYAIKLPSSNLLTDLSYASRTIQESLKEDEVELEIRSAALNFRDVFVVMKPSPQFEMMNTLGMDFSGVITSLGSNVTDWNVGDPVFGFSASQSVVVGLHRHPAKLLTAIPKNITFSEAAALPVAFITAWHCIVNVAKSTTGQTILIHAATGGVGLMAVQIANHLGLNVIGTAGSKRKRNHLRFLGLKNVFNSRSLEFGKKIQDLTNGCGVDMVLNCLTGPGFKETSLEVCKDGGHFVEISKLDVWQPEEVVKMRPNVHYQIADLASMDKLVCKQMLDNLSILVQKRFLQALPTVCFPASKIIDALSFLQKAKQIGKVVIEMPTFDLEKKCLKEQLFNNQSTYLITGGKGAIGFAIAEWMITRGAKFIVLLGRSSPTESLLKKIQELKRLGADIICKEADVSNFDQLRKVLDDIRLEMPPLRGVHHCSGVLSDRMISHQDWENFEYVMSPKVGGAFNMHKLTLGYTLDFFVLHSSMSCTLGSGGQTNYTAGNAYMEALMNMRHSMGLIGTCVSWGQWNAGLAEKMELKLFHAFSILQGIRALENIFCNNRDTCVAVGSIATNDIVRQRPICEKTFLEYIATETQDENGKPLNDGKEMESFLETYMKQSDDQDKLSLIRKLVKQVVSETLGLELHVVNDDTLFSELGMDSLLSIEFYNKLQFHLAETKLGFVDMEEFGSVRKMSEIIIKSLDTVLEGTR